MAWPWLAAAAKTIPWATLVRRAPDIIDAAGGLLVSRKTGRETRRRSEEHTSELQSR